MNYLWPIQQYHNTPDVDYHFMTVANVILQYMYTISIQIRTISQLCEDFLDRVTAYVTRSCYQLGFVNRVRHECIHVVL